MKKIKMYIFPIIVLILFIAIMNSGGIIKKPFTKRDDVYRCVLTLQNDVLNENWDKADVSLNELKAAWNLVRKRVQFSVERTDINTINDNISRIQGSLLIHDKSSAIIELSEITEHWDELER